MIDDTVLYGSLLTSRLHTAEISWDWVYGECMIYQSKTITNELNSHQLLVSALV